MMWSPKPKWWCNTNSLNFSRLKNYLKSYFITKREPDENQNV